MSSSPLTEFAQRLCGLFIFSCAALLAVNLFAESALSYELSERTRWHLLLLIFTTLIALNLPSGYSDDKSEDVQVSKPCNHDDTNRMIGDLRATIARLETRLETRLEKEKANAVEAESRQKRLTGLWSKASWDLEVEQNARRQDQSDHLSVSCAFGRGHGRGVNVDCSAYRSCRL